MTQFTKFSYANDIIYKYDDDIINKPDFTILSDHLVQTSLDRALLVALNYEIMSVSILLEYGANPNITNEQNTPAIIIAIERNQLENVNFLIKFNADVAVCDERGRNVLMCAAQQKRSTLEMLLFLDINVDIQDKNGLTALMYAAEDRPENVNMLLSISANTEIRDLRGRTVIMVAAKSQPKSLELLLEYGVSLDLKDNSGYTALMYAAMHEPINVKPLLNYGANPNIQRIHSGKTALTYAILKNQTHSVETLLEYNADPNIQTIDDGKTALMIAIDEYQAPYVKLILNRGADPDIRDSNGSTGLIIAVEKNRVECMNQILNYRVDQNIQNDSGWTALMYAANGYPKSVMSLLTYKGTNIEVQNNDGLTPLMIAAKNSPDCVELLLNGKANIEAYDNVGMTALLHAAHSKMQCVKVLIDAHANRNVIDIDGNDPFHIVINNLAYQQKKAGVEASLILFPSKIDQRTSIFVLTPMMMKGYYVKFHTDKLMQRILENKNLNLSQFYFEDDYSTRTSCLFLKYVVDLHDPTKQFCRLNTILMQTKTEKQAISISLEENEHRQELLINFEEQIKTLNEQIQKYKVNAFDSNYIDWKNGDTFFVKQLRLKNMKMIEALLTCPGFNLFETDYNLMTAIHHIDRILLEEIHEKNTKSHMNILVKSDIYKRVIRYGNPWFSKSRTIPCSNGRYPMLEVMVNGKHHCFSNPYVEAIRSVDILNHFILKIDDITIILPMKSYMDNMRNRLFSTDKIPHIFKNDGILNRLIPYIEIYDDDEMYFID